jgi:integrase
VQEWDEEKQKVITDMGVSPGREKELSSLQKKINKDFRSMAGIVKSLEDYGSFTVSDVIDAFRKKHESGLFCEFTFKIADKLHDLGKFGTSRAYTSADKSFSRFLAGKDIRLNRINASLMKEYEEYLYRSNCRKNTVSCYMRSLRASYNTAIREKLVTAKKENPFGYVFTGNATTNKRAINEQTIKRICALGNKMDDNLSNTALQLSCDLFMFSFFTQGMPFADMANLKWENIISDHIQYSRQKTGQMICIKMEDCMLRIINKYAKKNSGYIFPMLRECRTAESRWKKTQSALSTHNRYLKKLAKLAGIEETLTSYVPRHSWASIASAEGIPVATISRGMGHESEKTTRIYISRLDYSDVGEANHRIIMKIFGGNNQLLCCL